MRVIDVQPDIWVERLQPAASRFHFWFADLVYAEEDLALQVAIVYHVEIHDADGAYTSCGQIQQDGTAQTAGSDNEDFGGFQFLLGFDTETRDDDMAIISCQFFFCEKRGTGGAVLAGIVGSTAGDGGNDADNGILFYRGLFLLEVANIVVADKDIDIGADVPAFVEQVFAEIGEVAGQLLDSTVDRACAYLEACCVIGKLPQGSWDDNGCHFFWFFD